MLARSLIKRDQQFGGSPEKCLDSKSRNDQWVTKSAVGKHACPGPEAGPGSHDSGIKGRFGKAGVKLRSHIMSSWVAAFAEPRDFLLPMTCRKIFEVCPSETRPPSPAKGIQEP